MTVLERNIPLKKTNCKRAELKQKKADVQRND